MTRYKIRYSPEAVRDMDQVWDEVYEVSKKPFPFSGIPVVYRGLFTGFYAVNFKKYKAFYRVHDGYMEVIRVIMEKRDYMQILFGESE